MRPMLQGSSLACALLVLSACAGASVRALPSSSCESIGAFPGAEDFDFAELDGRPVIIASAAARRPEFDAAANGLYLVDVETRAVERLTLHGRDDCPLSPHGVATAPLDEGGWGLWAIVHYGEEGCEGQRHGVERFRLASDGLHFVERLTGPELVNPNDLDAVPDGRLWLSNNPAWIEGKGLVGDLLFRRARGQVLHYDPDRGFSVAATEFVFPNGIAVVEDALWVASAYGQLHRLELDEVGHERDPETRDTWKLRPKATLDNLMPGGEDELWVTGHPEGLTFIKHGKDPAIPSPTVAYRIQLSGGQVEGVAAWREGEVNAGSTVAPLGDALVLGMVFDPGLRLCERPAR